MSHYHATVTLHVLAAVVWLGGMLFFAVAAPVLRTVEDDAVRARLFDTLGRRYRVVGWICIGVLITTGVEQLRIRGLWGETAWSAPGFWSSGIGMALAWKLALVGFMLVIQAVHDFWLGPRAGAVTPGGSEAAKLRRRAALLARMNAVAGIVLVYFAVRLGRGG